MSSATEPALDPWGLEIGERLEDLSDIVPAQPYLSTGPYLGIAARELLVTLAGRRRLGWLDRRRNPAGVQDLVDAGTITPRGRLTTEGTHLVDPLKDLAASVVVDAWYGGHSTALRVHLGDGSAVVSAGPSSLELRSRDADPSAKELTTGQEDRARVEVVDNEAVPEVIARWMGLRPAWSAALHPEQFPAATLEARIADASTPPPAEADDLFLRAWREPWVVLTLDIDPGDFRLVLVNAGTAGFHTSGTTDSGQAELRPVPSAQMWAVLVDQIGVALQLPGR